MLYRSERQKNAEWKSEEKRKKMVKVDEEAMLAGEGGSSVLMTCVTMVKTSIGTGALALPFTYARGGVVPTVLMLVFLAAWNEFCGLRLIGCMSLLSPGEKNAYEASTESRLAALARVALGGSVGAALVEIVFFCLVFGIVTSYLVAAHDTLSAYSSLGNKDVYVAALLALPLTQARDVGKLAPVAMFGLFALFAAFAVTLFYCYYDINDRSLNWLGPEKDALSTWASGFGVLSFSFGVVPLAPQFAESMRDPKDFKVAQRYALALTVFVYIILGVSVAFLDPNVPGNVLGLLPAGAPPALVAKVTVGLVCVASTPIPVVAAAEIIEKKVTHKRTAGFIARTLLLFGSAFAADKVPDFALVVSIVGAATVSFLSFVLPLLLHLSLLLRQKTRSRRRNTTDTTRLLPYSDDHNITTRTILLDLIALIFGIIVVLFATALVTANAIHHPPHQTTPPSSP